MTIQTLLKQSRKDSSQDEEENQIESLKCSIHLHGYPKRHCILLNFESL